MLYFRTHIEMSSKEHAELYKRLQNPDFSSFHRRKRPFWVLVSSLSFVISNRNPYILKKDMVNPDEKNPIEVDEMDYEQVCWNQDLQYLGDVSIRVW